MVSERRREEVHETFMTPQTREFREAQSTKNTLVFAGPKRFFDVTGLLRCPGTAFGFLELEPRVQLSEVMEEREHREASSGHLIEIGPADCIREPPPENRISEQRLETSRDVGAVVLKSVGL